MKKTAFLVLLLILLSTACAPLESAPLSTALSPTSVAPAAVDPTAAATVTPEILATPSIVPTVAFTTSPPATCQLVPVLPQMDTLAQYGVSGLNENDHAYGAAAPKVTIISYCNYQKAACKTLTLNLAEMQQQYPGQVRVVLRQFPQPEIDDKSLIAAYAAEAAGLENRFWEMNNLLYTRQQDWLKLSPQDFRSWLMDQSTSLNISPAQLGANMSDVAVISRIDQSIAEAAALQLVSTPVLFFNNIMVRTSIDVDSLAVLVDYFLLPEKAYTSCPDLTIDTAKTYTATFKTEKGDIVFELFDDVAPLSVNSFIHLAQDGWYDGSTFFRVVPGFVVQGGDPSNSGLGTPGYGISGEVDPALRFATPGLLALNRNSDGLSGSQFFITYAELPEMDGQFTIIGRVIEGMSVVNSLRPRNPESDEILLPADVLVSITIEEK